VFIVPLGSRHEKDMLLRITVTMSRCLPQAMASRPGGDSDYREVRIVWLAFNSGGQMPQLDGWLDLSVLAWLPCDESCLVPKCFLTLAVSEH